MVVAGFVSEHTFCGAPRLCAQGTMSWASVAGALGAVGFLVSSYALWIDLRVQEDPGYVASCDVSPSVSCSRVSARAFVLSKSLAEAA